MHKKLSSFRIVMFQAKLIVNSQVVDVYREVFGFRTVTWSQDKIFINDRPFYCIGFGMHEDFEVSHLFA